MKEVKVVWVDSHMTESKWNELPTDYKMGLCTVTTYGVVVYEDDDIISIAHNIIGETGYLCRQTTSIMTIPKRCVLETISAW